MSYIAPGGTYTSRLALGTALTGLVGTVRFRLLDNDGTPDDPVYGPSTADIIEDPTGSGSYLFTGTGPLVTGNYSPAWDQGPGTDLWYDDDLVVTYTPATPGPTDAFASADDLAARLGLTFTTAEAARATTQLALATQLIQDETAQKISLVADDTLSVRSIYGERYRLPERPVLSVASVSITPQGGTPTVIGADTYYLEGDELCRASFPIHYQQFFADWTRGWLGPLFELTVVYTHGFAVIPGIVKAVCMEMVARTIVNPGAVAREQVGNTMTVYDNMRFSPTGLLMTDGERTQVTAIIRRQSGSIALR